MIPEPLARFQPIRRHTAAISSVGRIGLTISVKKTARCSCRLKLSVFSTCADRNGVPDFALSSTWREGVYQHDTTWQFPVADPLAPATERKVQALARPFGFEREGELRKIDPRLSLWSARGPLLFPPSLTGATRERQLRYSRRSGVPDWTRLSCAARSASRGMRILS